MGVKRPLRPQIAARYGEELSQVDQMAKVGYDPKTGELNEAIYGPKGDKFNVMEDMVLQQKNNITDGSFIDAMINQQDNETEPMPMPDPNVIQNALDAVQAEDPLFEMPVDQVFQESVPAPPPAPLPVPAPVVAPVVQPAPVAPPVAPVAPTPPVEPEPAKEEEKPPTPEEKMQHVADMLLELFGVNAPNINHLKQWKNMHGNVFVVKIDERVFLYRYLKRQEWKQLLASDNWNKMPEDQQEDYLSAKCTLWPAFTATTRGGLPAGTAPLLAEQIRIQSLFLDASAVASITIKL